MCYLLYQLDLVYGLSKLPLSLMQHLLQIVRTAIIRRLRRPRSRRHHMINGLIRKRCESLLDCRLQLHRSQVIFVGIRSRGQRDRIHRRLCNGVSCLEVRGLFREGLLRRTRAFDSVSPWAEAIKYHL